MVNKVPPPIIGETYGRLLVLSFASPLRGKVIVECCCGKRLKLVWALIASKTRRSCGCTSDVIRHGYARHGSKSAEYRIWNRMRCRCRNKNSWDYKHYGGRGITVCERWDNFANFLADMGNRPSPEMSIDRIDNAKGYSPENCRWATRNEQAWNTGRTKYVEIEGIRKSLSEWAFISGIKAATIRTRLQLGWPSCRLLDPTNPHSRWASLT